MSTETEHTARDPRSWLLRGSLAVPETLLSMIRSRYRKAGHGEGRPGTVHGYEGADMTQSTCTRHGCDRPVKIRKHGLCAAHYQQRWQSGGIPKITAPETCTVDDCTQPVRIKKHALCSAHYQRKMRTGDPVGNGGRLRADLSQICTVPSCGKPVLARELCSPHYQRNAAYGSPEGKSARPYEPKYKGESPEWVRDQVANRPRTGECWADGGFAIRCGGYPILSGSPVGWLSMEADGRTRPPGMYQLHSCDNPACWAPHHLRWGTPQENADDREARSRGVRNVGEAHGASLLTESDVRWIRATYAAGKNLPQRHPDKVSVREMARSLGVTTFPVHSVIQGRTWQHVR